MPPDKMHDDEVTTDVPLVRRLIETQFPQWAHLPIEPVHSDGTNNAIYRLGNELSVRLPLTEDVTLQLEKERQWLPRLAPHLPLAIPVPLAHGQPDPIASGESIPDVGAYPWHWSVYPWLPGEPATPNRLTDPTRTATDLAAFISALRTIDPTGGPPPGEHNFYRGVPLARRDPTVRRCIADLEDLIDTRAATAAWDHALQTPAYDGPPVWIHGDLSSGNMLASNGRLTAVIDWGGLAIGDPACELLVAWDLFSASTRPTFRAALNVDDPTWDRARGWALSLALIGLPYYRHTNPGFMRYAHRLLANALADHSTTA
jgi:aminoglycoside phosphotransferase (APT) family kinase protein